MHAYRLPLTQAEYELVEKKSKELGVKKGVYVRLLLQEARELQGDKFGIYIPFSPSGKMEERTVPLYANLHDDLHDFFVEMSSVAKGLSPGQLVRIYLVDMLERKLEEKKGF